MFGSQDYKQVGMRHNPPDNFDDRSQGNIGLDGNNQGSFCLGISLSSPFGDLPLPPSPRRGGANIQGSLWIKPFDFERILFQ
nr:hypothetical protein CFP56_29036 [Quercus suber]